MYGDLNADLNNLLKQASDYARSQVQKDAQVTAQAEADQRLRTWIFAGGAGLATIALLFLVLRR